MNEKNSLKELFENYGGAIMGGIIALILCFTRIYTILVYKNKSSVKEKLKEFIDRF